MKALTYIRQNLGSIIIALILSTILWVFVENQQNPEVLGLLPDEIAVQTANIPPDLVVVSDLPSVSARIAAPRDVWERLGRNALIVTVDLSNANEGFGEYPIAARAREPRVRVLEVSPSRVPVRLERVGQKTIPVRVSIAEEPPLGFSLESPKVTPTDITVKGPQSLVDRVAIAFVEVRLGNARSNFSKFLEPTVRDDRGSEIKDNDLSVSPAQVSVEVAVKQDIAYKVVAVVANVQGTPKLGYRIEGILPFPSTMTLSGDPKQLESISFIATDKVDITAATSDIVKEVEVSLPSGVSIVRLQNIVVRVVITPAPGGITVSVTPVVTGLDPRRTARIETSQVQVQLSGPQPLLFDLKPADVKVEVNAEGLGPGAYSLSPMVVTPPGLRMESLSPEKVLLTVQ